MQDGSFSPPSESVGPVSLDSRKELDVKLFLFESLKLQPHTYMVFESFNSLIKPRTQNSKQYTSVHEAVSCRPAHSRVTWQCGQGLGFRVEVVLLVLNKPEDIRGPNTP